MESLVPPPFPHPLLFLRCALFLLPRFCKLQNHDPWRISVSKPSTSVSNQRDSSDPFEVQTLCRFNRVRWWDKLLVRGRIEYRQQLGLSLQDFQPLPQKVGTENCCLTCSTRNVCKNVSSRPTGLFSRFCWNDSRLFFPFTQLFFQS